MAKKTYIIGRAGDITLYDDTVSRRHARLDIDGDRYELTDLDSRNGTYEIRDRQPVPFRGGVVTRQQVFAFGECVRSMEQLLAAVQGDGPAVPPAPAAGDADPRDATLLGVDMPAVQRLAVSDILKLLERAEDMLAAGGERKQVWAALGINEQRYERWSREYGATRADRDLAVRELRRENERLRQLVADISLERDALRDALELARLRARSEPPSLTLVNGDGGKGGGKG